MSGQDFQNEDADTFDLGGFIGDQSELFVILGVFGALAIYISQSSQSITPNTPDAELIIKTGFVSSFGLSMLMFALIYSKLVDEFGDWNSLLRAHFRLRNAALTMFSLFSMMLLISISYILTQNEPVIFLLLLMGTVIVGLGVVVRVIYGFGRRIPNTPVWRFSMLFTTSFVMLLSSQLLQTRVLSQFEVTTIQNLSLGEPIPVVITIATVLVVTIRSLSAGAILIGLIAIPIVAIEKLLGRSPYDKNR